MDFFTLVGVLRRRWIVVLPGVVLTIVAAAFMTSLVNPTYRASGSTLLLIPNAITEPGTGRSNPYLGFGSVQIPASIISQAVGQGAARAEIAEAGGTATFEVGIDPTSPAPVIVVVANGDDPDEVVQTAQLVIQRLEEELERRQRAVDAPEATWLTLDTLASPDEAFPQLGSRMRAIAAVLAAGMGVTVVAAVLVDNAGRRRERDGRPHADRRGDGGDDVGAGPPGVPRSPYLRRAADPGDTAEALMTVNGPDRP